MKACAIIPARLQSSRLPRKLLLEETGRPLLQYAWEAACRARTVARVIVATDSPEILKVVQAFGGECVLTGEHASGTDRVAEVVRRLDLVVDIVVNVQGDEPELNPAHVDLLVEQMRLHPQADMATLATPIRSLEQLNDPSCVKVVCSGDGRALYFSRLPIPYYRDGQPEELLSKTDCSPWLLHVGVYGYRKEFLLKITQLPPSPLEQLERLEQLRALECGAWIQVATVEHHSAGIDTPEDYARFCQRQRQKQERRKAA